MYGWSGFGDATAAQVAAYNAVVCPAGYMKYSSPEKQIDPSAPMSSLTMSNICHNKWSFSVDQMRDPNIANLSKDQDSQLLQGQAMMAAGAGLALLGDGWLMKLLGVGVGIFGWGRSTFIGGM